MAPRGKSILEKPEVALRMSEFTDIESSAILGSEPGQKITGPQYAK